MAGFEGVPEGIKQVLLATQEIKRLSENVRAPGGRKSATSTAALPAWRG
jgi:hypothetical protein